MEDEERRWTDENIDMVALKHFPNIDKDKAMCRPILYSNWLSKVREKPIFYVVELYNVYDMEILGYGDIFN